jgi:transcriptional regulator with XRE-family HTH domain
MPDMSTLEERLREIMDAKGWQRRDLVRITGQSSSVVSQWLGHGSKTIHTIQKIEAAIALEQESGFCAAWIAKGIGPKRAMAAPDSTTAPPLLQEAAAPYGPPYRPDVAELVDALAYALDALEPTQLGPVAQALQALTVAPDSAKARAALQRALTARAEATS